jgi:DNA invertase Pin-like site-specific DNA recombinase
VKPTRQDTSAGLVRAFAYLRVSEARDGMQSPAVQRAEISRFADARGWEVTAWFEDLDLSGRAWARDKRVGLDELLLRALAGECAAVVFYRVDRLAREEEDFHAILAALQRAGIHCDSVTNPNDGSPESALLWSISAALAKYESVKIGARIRDVRRRQLATGRYQGGPVAPYGFRRRSDGPGLVPEPAEVAWRLQMHDWY